MADILHQIVQTKRLEIEALKRVRSLQSFEDEFSGLPPRRDFIGKLSQSGMRLIAEVKKASPSAGVIRADFDPVQIAQTYQSAGADCLSVLTDESYFQGHLRYLQAIRSAVDLPLLRKEFILDEIQIAEAKVAGADAILLIAEILPGTQMQQLYDYATSIGLHVLIELHEADQVDRVVATTCPLIGINNRNLRTFETKLSHTFELMQLIPPDRHIISESGIRNHADVQLLLSRGVKGILVGESLMRASDIGLALRQLLHGTPE